MNQDQHTKGHPGRDDLTGEHKTGDIGQLILLITFITVWISDSFFLLKTTFLNELIPDLIRVPIAIILLMVSLWLARTSLNIVFGEVRSTPAVIRKSVYKYIRHPMYVSEILMYLGLLSFSLSIGAFIVLLIGMVFLFKICRYEERLLLKRFGDDYRTYLSQTPMWIPRLIRR